LLASGRTPIESKGGEARAAIVEVWNKLHDME